MACGGAAAHPGVAQAPHWRCLHAAAVQSVCFMVTLVVAKHTAAFCKLQASQQGPLGCWFHGPQWRVVEQGERLCCADLGCSVSQRIQCFGCHVRATA